MALQAVGANPFLPTVFGRNPLQTIGMPIITMLAINTFLNFPMVQAKDVATSACEIACEPLPGGKDDAPERICVKTCKEGTEIIKTKTKEVLKDGKWSTVKVLEKIATPIFEYFDCTSICNDPLRGGGRAAASLFAAGVKYFWSKDGIGALSDFKNAAAKTGCIALLATPAGYVGCMGCCAGTKYLGVD